MQSVIAFYIGKQNTIWQYKIGFKGKEGWHVTNDQTRPKCNFILCILLCSKYLYGAFQKTI